MEALNWCFAAISPLRLPAREQGSSGHSQVSELIACLPVLLSICQFCGHAGEKWSLHVRLCVRLQPRNQRGSPSFTRRHDTTHLPAGRSRSERRRHGRAQLSSPLQLPLISPFFRPFIPLGIHPVIFVPVQSHSSSAPQLHHEPSFLSGPEQTHEKGARLPEIS